MGSERSEHTRQTEGMTLAVKVNPVLKRAFVVMPFSGAFATVPRLRKLIFLSPVATAEFSKFAGILSEAF